MLSVQELKSSPEYHLEVIQNELYRELKAYLEKEGISQSDFAKKLGVSKGYVSQVLNGNFNFTLAKLIELSLAIGKYPQFNLLPIDKEEEVGKSIKLQKVR